MKFFKLLVLVFILVGCHSVKNHPLMKKRLYVYTKSGEKVFLDNETALQIRSLLRYEKIPKNSPPLPASGGFNIYYDNDEGKRVTIGIMDYGYWFDPLTNKTYFLISDEEQEKLGIYVSLIESKIYHIKEHGSLKGWEK